MPMARVTPCLPSFRQQYGFSRCHQGKDGTARHSVLMSVMTKTVVGTNQLLAEEAEARQKAIEAAKEALHQRASCAPEGDVFVSALQVAMAEMHCDRPPTLLQVWQLLEEVSRSDEATDTLPVIRARAWGEETASQADYITFAAEFFELCISSPLLQLLLSHQRLQTRVQGFEEASAAVRRNRRKEEEKMMFGSDSEGSEEEDP